MLFQFATVLSDVCMGNWGLVKPCMHASSVIGVESLTCTYSQQTCAYVFRLVSIVKYLHSLHSLSFIHVLIGAKESTLLIGTVSTLL